MAPKPPSQELQLALQRFFDLSAGEQLQGYREIRDALAERARETKHDRVATEKPAALDALAAAAAHVARRRACADARAQFDAAARDLVWGAQSRFMRRSGIRG